MEPTNLNRILDRLEQGKASRGDAALGASGNLRTPESVLGLRFQRGDIVLDLATGSRGEVMLGERVQATGEERYQVSLYLGGNVWRGRGELEKVSAQ